ncbi:putative ribonuclease P [Helianthus annuus]|uniref:ribonuclease P n=1 Tax=Helianthus annuus TaxID=4232 RepID=A0A251VHZ3_HELAN|nr:proteinaceous RNase P 2 [Helianthus annuus]KAF5819718.1 putative ribonuclease P [Helianthus annuus]KAJ0619847.1 putative ribonuclease P [Helianthus annuus]KAJ0787281.1 putative ribonuclease P [Helianthus annuus]KAJ0952947.1 putative ribonuclease P [Helianthus annuus]
MKKNSTKTSTPATKFHSDFSTCSKNKDFTGAITLFDYAISQNLKLNLHHLNCFLYICANSTESFGALAIEKGFHIYNYMISSKINPNEATITAVSRLAAANNDADYSFELVKSLGNYNVKPRLRTYDAALFCYVKLLDAEKAYAVEDDMLTLGLCLEEPEISALLKVSVEVGDADKVYGYLHKLRAGVRCVGEETVAVIERWFSGRVGEGVGCGVGEGVKEVMVKNGGGWHGLGWLGKGKWAVRRTSVGLDGGCCGCGERLACVDIGKEDTEKFAQSVVALAVEREKRSNFTQFQNWLDQHNDFEAIVDAANIGLYQQNFADGGFSVPQLEAVVKELYNRSNKWPLVILHEKRLHTLLANPCNREILQEWIENGILYGTPVGSNDDWYWLYASVKLKCMLVTNDEMRDHIFELLGSNFFPRWKERHQVHYAFPKGQLKLEMPPSYSIVIQESERGAWHVPVTGEYKDESQRTWLCVTRPETFNASDEFAKSAEARESGKMINGNDLNPCSNSLNNSETICITGKRKERSESPTE